MTGRMRALILARKGVCLLALVLLLGGFDGDPDALAVFEQVGKSGTYGLDCDRPASPENPRQIFASLVNQQGKNGLLIGLSTAEHGIEFPPGHITRIKIAKDKTLMYGIETPSHEELGFHWSFINDRLKLLDAGNITTHTALVSGGRIPTTGIQTPTYTRCIPHRKPD